MQQRRPLDALNYFLLGVVTLMYIASVLFHCTTLLDGYMTAEQQPVFTMVAVLVGLLYANRRGLVTLPRLPLAWTRNKKMIVGVRRPTVL